MSLQHPDEKTLERFDTLIGEGKKILELINSDDARKRRQMKGIMAVGFEFHDRGADVQAYKVRFHNFLESLLDVEKINKLMAEVEAPKYASTQIERIVGTLIGLKTEYQNGSLTIPYNSNLNAIKTLEEFDALISDLKALVAAIPDFSHDRHNRGNTSYISPENESKFLSIRTRCLRLLTGIDSKDTNLKQTIDYIRDSEVHLFNIRSILQQIQGLRSDYEAKILTLFPRLPEVSPAISGEKRRWLDEPKAIIVAAIIGVVGVILAAIVSFWLGQANSVNSLTNNALILTYTPVLTATFEPTLEPTAELTVEP